MGLKKHVIKRNKKGFSLVELIVVMGIIAVLGIVAVPKYNQYLKNARLKSDYTSAKVIADVAQVYSADNGGKDFTADLSLDSNVLKDYLGKVPEVQSESGMSFQVSCVDGEINVYYETSGANAKKFYFYPKDKPEEAVAGNN